MKRRFALLSFFVALGLASPLTRAAAELPHSAPPPQPPRPLPTLHADRCRPPPRLPPLPPRRPPRRPQPAPLSLPPRRPLHRHLDRLPQRPHPRHRHPLRRRPRRPQDHPQRPTRLRRPG